MKRRFNVMATAIVLSTCILFSSCIGSFTLCRKLLDWNNGVGDKYINELVFVAFNIVPVYPIALLADVLVLNSIEFWTDENPMADVGKVKKVESANGTVSIETKKDGYHIEKEGSDEVVDFSFDKEHKIWSVEVNGESRKIMQIINEDKVLMFLPDGSSMPVSLNEAGVYAYRQTLENTYYALK